MSTPVLSTLALLPLVVVSHAPLAKYTKENSKKIIKLYKNLLLRAQAR